MKLCKSLGRSIEVLTFTDAAGVQHLQVRFGRTVLAAIGQTISPPLPASRCNRVLDIGRGMVGYAVGVTLLRRWHVSLTAERVAAGVRLKDDLEGTDSDPMAALS